MSGALLDIRHAFRLLRNHPWFSALVILTLSLGIGANAALFSVMDAVWLRALPSRNADRLVAMWLGGAGMNRVLPSTADFEQWQQYGEIFENLSTIATNMGSVTVDAEPHDVNVARVQTGLFAALGERPLFGRLLAPSDEAPGAPAVALVSARFFHQRLGSNPDAVGRAIRTGTAPLMESVVVVGVLPERFSRIVASGLIRPALSSSDAGTRRPVRVVGLLRPGVSVSLAQARLEAGPSASAAWRPFVISLRDSVVGADVGRVLNILFGAVGLLLLMACANVANLLLARLADREREIAVRTAVGADRWRLTRQLLTESMVLSLSGAAVGLLLAHIAKPLLISLMPARTPGLEAIVIDARVLAFTAVAAVVTAAVAGLWPVLRLSPARADQLLAGRSGDRATRGGTSKVLLSVQVALALVAVIAAGTLSRSFANLIRVDPGFSPDNIVTLRMAPAPPLPPGRPELGPLRRTAAELEQGRAVLEELGRLPSVQAAGGVSVLPLQRSGGMTYSIRLEDRSINEAEDRMVVYDRATPEYFETLGIPLRAGRLFTDADRYGAAGVVIVNQRAAQRFWPGENPIGRRVFLGTQEPLTVVGVIGDVRQRALDTEPVPAVYRPWLQEPERLIYVVRTTDRTLLRTLAAPDAAIAGLKVMEVSTLDDHVMETVREPQARMRLFVLLGAVVLLLTIVGVAGLTAHTASRRRREAGIRLALGATPRQVITLIIRQSVPALAAGVVCGWLVAWWATRFLESLLFDVPPQDPLTFVVATTVVMLAALTAAWMPARRAGHLDPAVTLRAE